MKLGYCLNMVSRCQDKTGREYIETLKAVGYDYAELPLSDCCALSEHEMLDTVRMLCSAGIPCEVCNNFFPVSVRLTGGAVMDSKVECYVRKALETAAMLGAKCIVFGSGAAKNVPEGFPLQKGVEQVANLLRKVSEAAARYSIEIVIEPLRPEECNIINSFEDGCKLCDEVGRANVNVLADLYHMYVQNEPLDFLRLNGKKYLRHVHIAQGAERACPTDPRAVADFIAVLKGIGYDGRISVEAYTNAFSADSLLALKMIKALING